MRKLRNQLGADPKPPPASKTAQAKDTLRRANRLATRGLLSPDKVDRLRARDLDVLLPLLEAAAKSIARALEAARAARPRANNV